MADFGISYSHRDDGLAAQVRQELVRRGAAVWMDEPGDGIVGAEDITLPWGQDHWNVITTEFAAADMIIVIDTPAWRASRYCQDEYRFLLDWGKRVEFIPAPTADISPEELSARIDVIVGQHAVSREVTSAHARLVQSLRAGRPSTQSRAERFLGRAEERDARLLLASTRENSGVTLTPALTAHAQGALERAGTARKRLRRTGISAVTILAVLAVGGVVALTFARTAYRAAAQSSARSQSLDLASRAQQEVDTVKAAELAHRAQTLLSDTASQEAVNVASARDARLRTIIVGPLEYYGAAWAADRNIVVGYSATKLLTIDADTGASSTPIDVPKSIQIGTVVVSNDGTSAAFVTRDDRTLHIAHLTERRTEDLGVSAVSAVATGDGSDLWWATDDGTITAARFSDPRATQHHYAVAVPALGMDVTPGPQLLDYVDSAGRVHTMTYDDSTLTEVDAFDATSPDKVAATDRQAVATVKRCGDNVFGGIAGAQPINGTAFSRIHGEVNSSRLFGSMSKAICSNDDKAWYTLLTTGGPHAFADDTVRPYLPMGSNRYLTVADPRNRRTATLTNDGKLYQEFDHPVRVFSADGALSVLPMVSGDFYVMASGDVVNAATRVVTGHMESPLPQSASVLGDDAVVAGPNGIAHIDASGNAVNVLDVSASDTLTYLRAGADGKHFVATLVSSILLIARDGTSTMDIPVGNLQFGESIADADISPDGGTVAYSTNAGRVGALAVNTETGSATAPQMWDQLLAGGNHIRVSFVPTTGDLIVVPTDGVVRLLDTDLNVVATTFFGVEPDHLTVVGDWAIISSLRKGTVLYNARNLAVQDRISIEEVPSVPMTARLDLSGSRLVLLAYIDGATGQDAVRFDVPLPGM